MDENPHQKPEELLSAARTATGEHWENVVTALLDRYRNYLSVLAKVYIDCRLQAKADDSDLVQETMMQAYHDFNKFRGTTEPELTAWLRKILASKGAMLARHYFGTKQRNVRLERQVEHDVENSAITLGKILVDNHSSPSEKASRRERAVLLADALGELPNHYREVIILHHFEGLTIPEVASRMGRTSDGVQKIWARAVYRLRNELRGLP